MSSDDIKLIVKEEDHHCRTYDRIGKLEERMDLQSMFIGEQLHKIWMRIAALTVAVSLVIPHFEEIMSIIGTVI